ncbi:hypothetical protein XNC1_1796 [Xenorhabdus nematophila ATCC 19061]|uniref:Uncharacterized protein n=1 Tax=Xenorhabdus nematophila (strain ATCC 19061 / DSM 3370 / CCUG 14189 / LMG 1036 / NCIMB 9965 / AN6) TaxID=406817 RepID=D3VCZ0_XENNA|nr:hypothetical protein XNC1_1796 [Xenorhabdus nematophila ATCC 19061]
MKPEVFMISGFFDLLRVDNDIFDSKQLQGEILYKKTSLAVRRKGGYISSG